MSEEQNIVKAEKQKKKHSFWWVWLLLVLVVFIGGAILALKLPELGLPTKVVDIIYDVTDSRPKTTAVQTMAVPKETEKPQPTAAMPAVKPTEAPEPTDKPEASKKPEPKESPKPTETHETEAKEIAAEYIGIEKAVKAALDYAMVSEKDAFVFGVIREKADGETVYAVEFNAGSFDYMFYVNSISGAVEGWRISPTIWDGADRNPAPEAESKAEGASNLPQIINADKARKIALEYAGVSEGSALNVNVELELENGNLVYEIEFKSGLVKYDCEIDAVTGAVLKAEKN